jgi:hypothetical protein
VSPEEKATLWPVIVDAYPPYDEYQARSDRDIPVFVCDPLERATEDETHEDGL